MNSPYIGVTGFMSKEEITEAVGVFDRLPYESDRKLMVGVLASCKTLAGFTNKHPNRYPRVNSIEGLFPPHRRTLNLIHYATDDSHTLDDQLETLIRLGGRDLDGFQLNVCWPDPNTINVPKCMRIVLQLGSAALQQADNRPETVAEMLDYYKDRITDVLVDASAGKGIPINPDTAQAYVRAIRSRHRWLGVGVAGGLCSSALPRLRQLAEHYTSISFDAEGRLRDEEDHLDMKKVKPYIQMADGLFDH